jgi:hypothetical protein
MIKIGVKNQIKKTTDAEPHFRFACSVSGSLSRAVPSEPDFFPRKSLFYPSLMTAVGDLLLL